MSDVNTEERKDEGAESGYAEAQHWCEHVEANVQPIDLAQHEQLDPNRTVCSLCPATENWFCLQCQTIFCSRFAQGHMLAHYEATGHSVAAGFGDLSFWCFKCESYLFHRTIPKLYEAYTILHMLKFQEAPVDYPLPSAEPTPQTRAVAAGTAGYDGSDDETNSHMETSRTAAARQLPERASSQLEALSQDSSAEDIPDSQMTEPEEEEAASAGGAPAAASAAAAPAATSSTAAPGAASASISAFAAASSAAAPPSAAAAASSVSAEPMPIAGLSALEMAHPLVDRILGVIYGNALGDAFGLATEFENRQQIAYQYGPTYDATTGEGAIPFPHTKKTRHSRRWTDGDWTDDTSDEQEKNSSDDQMILIMETMVETFTGAHRLSTDRTPSPQLFASKLFSWVMKGFPELGDEGGMGLGALTSQVVSNKCFLKEPHKAAAAAWNMSNKQNAANGGVMRTSVCGIFDFNSPSRVFANTAAMCGVTHADPRCLASCVLITELISAILRGADITTSASIDSLISRVMEQTLSAVSLGGEHSTEFRDYVNVRSRSLAALELDDNKAGIGYTNRCMSCGLFGLRSEESFEVTLTRIAREGGDADTNGAVAGAMLGAKLGYRGLPAEWIRKMPHTDWLAARVTPFVRLVLERAEALKGVPEPAEFGKAASCVIC